MQFSHALILAFVASVAAQTGSIEGDVAALPACAKTCIDKATLAAGCKTVTDYECQCGAKYGEINAAAAPCVATTCEPSDLAKSLALATEICALVKAGGATGGDESSSAASSPASSSAPSSTGGSDTTAPTVTGGSSTGGSAPTTTGGSAPSSTGETEPSSTGDGETSSTGGAPAPTSSEGAAPTGSWSFAAVAAGAGVVAAGLL
ncbi:hypothetical protein V496_04077 [Pseudogymnoascus sp. VKM F-4515 (FW-2607)]|nr:hypothetical protein V496_04077 [Pseudogymnoascus sp. VKM F-4515 (FW-2607)]KFY98908.1 hypothetical protein V498_01135 [Pseudogymnoascus sp. VKM F-4517 (FW-2822)]